MAPSDTLFIEKTAKSSSDDLKYVTLIPIPSLSSLTVVPTTNSSFISIDIWDLPGGQLDPDNWPVKFDQLGAVIFVLDAQSTFQDMNRKLAVTMFKAFKANPGIQFEIFLHKIDGMSEDYRLGKNDLWLCSRGIY